MMAVLLPAGDWGGGLGSWGGEDEEGLKRMSGALHAWMWGGGLVNH
jgi:hypothetical protein